MQTTISNFIKMAESSQLEYKTLWEKEKLLITCNFSFSYSVFKRLVLQTRKNQGLFRKGSNVLKSIVGKGENASYQHFILFSFFCERALFQRLLKHVNLLPLDEICSGHFGSILCNKEQFIGKELLGGYPSS